MRQKKYEICLRNKFSKHVNRNITLDILSSIVIRSIGKCYKLSKSSIYFLYEVYKTKLIKDSNK
jgi:hypothetical protein